MLTGQADLQAVTNALNSADLYRYIPKPWESTDLALTVKEALRRHVQDKQLAEQNTILQNMNTLLEQQVQERTTELEAQKLELERKNTLLKEVNASKDKFFSIIAHDLKNPFTSLLGYTDLIVDKFDEYPPEELKQEVRHLRFSAKQLHALLNNLLTWSRIQRGVMPYQPTDTELSELIRNTIYLFAAKAKQKQISLQNKAQGSLMAYVDYNMIDTVLRNLVSNALKFTPAEGSVQISASRQSHAIEILIADTGIGISESGMAKLFRIDAHYSKPGTQGEEGTGLGLILCKELVEKNGGTLRLESCVGEGTTFYVTLPRSSNGVLE
jgi:signal transduction histidine kinase